MKVFISYNFPDERFVSRVIYFLRKQPNLDYYYYSLESKKGDWRKKIGDKIAKCDKFILFLGKNIGKTQENEIKAFERLNSEDISDQILIVHLPDHASLDTGHFQIIGNVAIEVTQVFSQEPQHQNEIDDIAAMKCSKEIAIGLFERWISDDNLPIGYPFDYEKDVIEQYVKGNGRLVDLDKLRLGCTEKWPGLKKIDESNITNNPITENVIGSYRPEDAKIIVDVRSKYHTGNESLQCCLSDHSLTFLEAGPREHLIWPREDNNLLTVGILVSGGIAPGINSVITGIVERHHLYQVYQEHDPNQRSYTLQIHGYRDGFAGLMRNDRIILTKTQVREHANQGGCFLGTSRHHALLDPENPIKRDRELTSVVRQLMGDQIDILYIIGGDGTMRAAHAIWSRAQIMYSQKEIQKELSIIAIPKTMDNDILWVWQAFGFLSAVEKAKEFVYQLHTEARSNPRLCLVQLFGSDSGFVVSHTALASGECDAALIPEVSFSMNGLFNHIKERLNDGLKPGSSPHGIILVAETAIPVDVEDYLDDPYVDLEDKEKQAIQKFIEHDRRVQGQTPDELRSGSLKIISRVLQKKIRNMRNKYWKDFRVFTNEPRHLIRAIDPSVQDIITAQRLGILAVDNAMAGYSDFMISQWVTEYVLVPLSLVVLGRKRVPQNGIFWKSVLSNTGQPSKMGK